MHNLGKYIISFLILVLPLGHSSATETTDSLPGSDLTYKDIEMVMHVFDGMAPSEVIRRADTFIQSGKTKEETAVIAWYAYNYYRSSKIMGYEEIAIYIADNYFLNGAYQCPVDGGYMAMKLFADYTRSSLVRMPAPIIYLQGPRGDTVSTATTGWEDYSVLYFYDDECPTCKKQTPALLEYLQSANGMNFLVTMVFTGDDLDRWNSFIRKTAGQYTMPECVRIRHAWDPEITSDYVRKYGVVSTPQLFLVNRTGTIIGRGLTAAALAEVVRLEESRPTSRTALYENIFSPVAETEDSTDVTKIVDMFFNDTKDSPELFNEIFFSLYQYLKSSPYYIFQKGAMYIADKYILGMPSMWENVTFISSGVSSGSRIRAGYATVDDFMEDTRTAIGMFYRNPLGKPVSDLALRTEKNRKMNIYSIDAGYTVLYFYTLDCGLCSAVTEEMHRLSDKYADKDIEFAAIYVGKSPKWKKFVKNGNFGWINLWDRKSESSMFDLYDLMDVPAIYILDKDKNTIAKDINPEVLENVLDWLLE